MNNITRHSPRFLSWLTILAVAHLKQQGTYASLQEALAVARYQVEPSGAAADHLYQTENPAHGLRAFFTKDGARVVSAGTTNASWETGLRLTAYGYGNDLRPVPGAEVIANGNRVEYRRGHLIEWYVNDAKGLEQWFRLEQPPSKSATGPKAGERLTLAMAAPGNLKAALSEDGQNILFRRCIGQDRAALRQTACLGRVRARARFPPGFEERPGGHRSGRRPCGLPDHHRSSVHVGNETHRQ